MGNLYYQSGIFHNREEVGEVSIVDVLTRNDARTSVYAPRDQKRLVSEIIGVNSVCQGKPITLGWPGPGFHERGFVDPEHPEKIYLIQADKKVVAVGPNKILLFYDADKVHDENHFEWRGTFDEFLAEFRNAGYEFEDING